MLKRKLTFLAANAFCFAAVASPLLAGPIALNQWYTFGFFDAGTMAVSGDGFVLGANSVVADDPPWTFSSPGTSLFTITDGFSSGDSFTVFDSGALVGSTAIVPTGANCGNDEPACLANLAMSSESFLLSPGAHSITIRVDTSPFGSGAAFFRVDAVAPEPTAWMLLTAGLLIVPIARFRRKLRA
jgi:hypothetical protein